MRYCRFVFALALLVFAPGSSGLLVAILILNAVAGASWAFINVGGSVVASRLAPAEAKGQVMGLYNAAIGAGSIAGSLLGGIFAQHMAYVEVFAAASGFIALGAIVIAVSSAAGTVHEGPVRWRALRSLGFGGLLPRAR